MSPRKPILLVTLLLAIGAWGCASDGSDHGAPSAEAPAPELDVPTPPPVMPPPEPEVATSRPDPLPPVPPPAPPVDPMLSVGTLHPAPEHYARERIGTAEWPIPPHARYLAGVRICLDPGHGGDAHRRGYKRGPTGVREAEMNLRVARYLRDLLEAAGAEVLLTRDDDVEVSLPERAEIANRWGADLFISCHHNAVGKPSVNRTSVWHHRDVDHRPANLDLARYLLQGLNRTLDFPQITGDSLKSDQLMYRSGFGILRHADVTAALCESSFFTNPEEEQRLRDPEHNLREAYGMFLGLVRYAYTGLPRAKMVEPPSGIVTPDSGSALAFQLDDGLRARGAWGSDRSMILASSLELRLDGEPLPFTFDGASYRLEAELPEDLASGGHRVELQFQNKNKNSILDPHFVLDVPGVVAAEDSMSLDSRRISTDPWLQDHLVAIDRALCRSLQIPVEARALGLLDLDRGRLAAVRPDTIFYAASLPKIAILLAWFEANPDAAMELDPEVRRELGLMIKRSDNALAAKYSEALGLETIRDVLTSERYRLYDPERGGGLWMGKHYAQDSERLYDPVGEHSHAATVRQVLRYYLMLDQGRLVSPQASRVMKEIFAAPELEHLQSYFVKGLAGWEATLLRKSGTWEDWALDSALVEFEGGRYLLVGMSHHPRGGEYLQLLATGVHELMSEVSQ
jgi:N-acetylmuramoyl-L-alanine amidase